MKIKINRSNILMNKAFTLIELLAVIVILAIIALIVIPIVLNIVEDAKKSAVLRSAEMYIYGIELNIANQQLNKEFVSDGEYNIVEFSQIEIKGEKPSNGMVKIEGGKIIDYSFKIENYVVNYDKVTNKPIINGEVRSAEPNVDIIEGMTPIQYKNNNWVVIDSSKSDWYSYNNQEWANAVILNTGVSKNIGDTVDIASEVKGMFVYIPRYEYKIEGTYGKNGTSAEQPGETEINFVTKRVTKASKGYRVHPAFTFGEEELNGIWVGKFETTGTGEDPTILPSVTSLRGQNASLAFETSQKFNEYITNGDSHMAKNSEWGAIAYLSQSKYGKYGNPNYSEIEKEIMINNCSDYITGVGADTQNAISTVNTCTTNTYETNKGQAASTTGNITGIYDMSGGSWERVMGVLLDSNGNPRSGNTSTNNSGYTGMLSDGTIYSGKEWPEAKYYETYTSTINTSCNGGVCYGQALSETLSWYGDYAGFIDINKPWFSRGGGCSNTLVSGAFYFSNAHGGSGSSVSFRVVASAVNNS